MKLRGPMRQNEIRIFKRGLRWHWKILSPFGALLDQSVIGLKTNSEARKQGYAIKKEMES